MLQWLRRLFRSVKEERPLRYGRTPIIQPIILEPVSVTHVFMRNEITEKQDLRAQYKAWIENCRRVDLLFQQRQVSA